MNGLKQTDLLNLLALRPPSEFEWIQLDAAAHGDKFSFPAAARLLLLALVCFASLGAPLLAEEAELSCFLLGAL